MISEKEDRQLAEEVRAEIQTAVDAVDALPPQDPTHIFDLVYEEPTAQLAAQRRALTESRQEG